MKMTLNLGFSDGGPRKYNTRSVVNAGALVEILGKANTRLVDTIINTDSNGLFGGYGWDHGEQRAMFLYFGAGSMYGTGIHAFNEAQGGGQGVGYAKSGDGVEQRFRAGGINAMAAEVNIPTVLKDYWNSYLDPNVSAGLTQNHLMPAIWLSTTDPTAAAVQNGMAIAIGAPIGLSGHKYQLWAAKFNSTTYPSGGNAAIWQVNGGNNLTSPNYACTDAGATRVPSTPFEITLNAQTAGFEVRRQSPTAASADAYPLAFYFQRIVKSAATSGFALSMGYSTGSSTTTHCLNYWNAMGATRLANYIWTVIYQQTVKGQAPYLLVEFCFGINDASAGISTATFKSNLLALIALYRTAWASLNLGANARLRFVVRVTHPTTSSDTNLSGYRTVAAEIANTNSDVSAINMTGITNFTELNTGTTTIPAYTNTSADGGTDDPKHLKTLAYNNDTYTLLWERVLIELFSGQPDWITGSNDTPQFAGGFAITPYQLLADTPYYNLTFTEVSGTFATGGLSMNSAGLITGTASGGATGVNWSVTVKIAKSDDPTIFVNRTFNLRVSADVG